MRTIGLAGTTDSVSRIINELAGKYSHSKEFVGSVALTILDTHDGCALASAPGEQNALHNAIFSRSIQRDLPAVRTRSSCHFAIRQSGKAQAQSSKVLHFAR
jgi:hypothetical protein